MANWHGNFRGDRGGRAWDRQQAPAAPADPRAVPPDFARPVIFAGDVSCMLVDMREQTTTSLGRMIDPFQGEHIVSIERNAQHNPPRTGDTRQGFDPLDGLYVSMMLMKTMANHQMCMVLSVDYAYGSPGAEWTGEIGEGLMHPAFQPLNLPDLAPGGAPYMDIKVKYNNHPLVHVAGTGHNGYRNFSLETFTVNQRNMDSITPGRVEANLFQITIVVIGSMNVVAHSFNMNGRLYSLGAKGVVLASGCPRIHFEFRKVLKESKAAMGMNADQVSVVFQDVVANKRCELRQQVCPAEWIKFSNPGAGAVQTLIQQARHMSCRVEAPDQLLRWAQLDAGHKSWTAIAVPAATMDERTSHDAFLAMGEHPQENMHLTVTRGSVFLPFRAVEADALMLTDSLGAELDVDRDALRPSGLARAHDVQPKARPMNVAPE